MTEHIVAVFNSESAADAAARDLEQADIPASAIRRYNPAASDRYAGSSTSSGGGFSAKSPRREPRARSTAMKNSTNGALRPENRCSA